MNYYVIVIIDDEEGVQLLYTEEFEDEGFVVYNAYCGDDGLEIIYYLMHLDLRKFNVIVILDINLPGMNGIEVLRRIQENYNDITVILSSAYQEYKQDIGAWASDEYIVKSASLDELMEAVYKYKDRDNIQYQNKLLCNVSEEEQIRIFQSIRKIIIDECNRLFKQDEFLSLVGNEINSSYKISQNIDELFSRSSLIEFGIYFTKSKQSKYEDNSSSTCVNIDNISHDTLEFILERHSLRKRINTTRSNIRNKCYFDDKYKALYTKYDEKFRLYNFGIFFAIDDYVKKIVIPKIKY